MPAHKVYRKKIQDLQDSFTKTWTTDLYTGRECPLSWQSWNTHPPLPDIGTFDLAP